MSADIEPQIEPLEEAPVAEGRSRRDLPFTYAQQYGVLLDEATDRLCTRILMLMPDCTSKTVNSIRKHKQKHWDLNAITNREWLGLNMMTEAKAGFRAFNEGPKGNREVDFIKLRQLLAQGHPWDDDLLRAVSPQYQLQEQD